MSKVKNYQNKNGLKSLQSAKSGQYEFKRAGNHDIKPIIDLYNYYIKNSTSVLRLKTINAGDFKDIFKNIELYKIIAGKQFCGFCGFEKYNILKSCNRATELNIYLKPEFTGKGIGPQAIEFMEKRAVNFGLRTFFAGISSDNKYSIKLFKNSGYKKCGHIKQTAKKFGRTLDAVWFQKIK